MAKDDGGPAFAHTAHYFNDSGERTGVEVVDGMSLRDWFAGQYAPMIAAEWAKGGLLSAQDFANAAYDGYFLADALIAEKRRTEVE